MPRILAALVIMFTATCAFAADAPENNALIPVPKLENDNYDWYARHEAVLKAKQTITPEVVMIGDSITHFWAGEPASKIAHGPKAWADLFGPRPVLNLGFGWDRTQNVLWRLDHAEFDGLHPKCVVLNIGTNNLTGTKNARESTPAEIADAVRAIIIRVRSKSPESKIILMGIFPRGEKSNNPMRAKITATNTLLADLAKIPGTPGITFLDIAPKLLQPDGSISRTIMSDFCHPTEKGYTIWAEALKPVIAEK